MAATAFPFQLFAVNRSDLPHKSWFASRILLCKAVHPKLLGQRMALCEDLLVLGTSYRQVLKIYLSQ